MNAMSKFLFMFALVVVIGVLPLVAKKVTGLRNAKPAFVGNPVFVLNQ
jgi:hypothetical protein